MRAGWSLAVAAMPGGLLSGCMGTSSDAAGAGRGSQADFMPEDDIPLDPADLGDEGCALLGPETISLPIDDSNSMSSPAQARDAMLTRTSLDFVPVRPWEFLNYHSFDYVRAEPGMLAPHLDLVQAPEGGRYTLQVGVASAQPPQTRPPLDLALVVDNSYWARREALEDARMVGGVLAKQLRPGDRVSVVSWSDRNNVLLQQHAVSGPGDPVVSEALDKIEYGPIATLESGLKAGYSLLEGQGEGRISRLVVLTAGAEGLTEGERALVEAHSRIPLVAIGVGAPAEYRDELMEQASDLGGGATLFISEEEEARRMLGERFASTLLVAARDIQVQLDLPPGFTVVPASDGEPTEPPRAQDLGFDDVLVLHREMVSCDGLPVPAETAIRVKVSWSDVDTGERKESSLQTTFGELLAKDPRLLHKGAAILAYAEALRAARDGGDATVAARQAIKKAISTNPGDTELYEIREVLSLLRSH